MDQTTIIPVVVAFLLLLTGIAAGVVLWCALRLVRRKGDAARSWLAVYKASFALFVLALALSLVYLLQAIFLVLRGVFDVPAGVRRIRDAQEHLSYFGVFFQELAIYLASVAILGLAAGIRIVHANRELPADRIPRQVSYGIAVPFGAIDAVILGLNESRYVNDGAATTEWVLTLTIVTIQLLFAILLLVWSIIVAARTKSESRVKTATKYLLGCCVLLLVRASYDIAMVCDFITSWMERCQIAAVILFVVFRIWSVFALFVLLFVLGAKKQHGLWASHQEFTMMNPDGQAMSQQARNSESQVPQNLSVPPSELYSSLLAHELYGSQLALELPGQERRSRQQLHELDAHNSQPTHSEATGLYHRADGAPSRESPVSSNDKNKGPRVCVR